MLWEVDIHPAEGQPDLAGQRTAAAAEEMNLLAGMAVATARGFLRPKGYPKFVQTLPRPRPMPTSSFSSDWGDTPRIIAPRRVSKICADAA